MNVIGTLDTNPDAWDAVAEGAQTKEIITAIEDYQNLDTTVVTEYQAQDTVSDNKNR